MACFLHRCTRIAAIMAAVIVGCYNMQQLLLVCGWEVVPTITLCAIGIAAVTGGGSLLLICS